MGSESSCEFHRGPYLTVVALPLCKSFTTMSLFGCLRLSEQDRINRLPLFLAHSYPSLRSIEAIGLIGD